ncbi:unnamed protein product [Parnassius apollo]|uniref:(apollo) hypothetical protein n=1 Tax=Parnassius apollo TaxID=110799 RepID=A0A8S3XDT8_PARAO|nr:unnamed protein product [Parnassius apollo]
MQARVVIENTFSRLKNRWRCLHKDRVLHYKSVKCAHIILACSVLHNIIINFGVEDTEENIGLQFERTIECDQISYTERGEATSDLIRGRMLRDQLARRLQ